MGYTFEFKREFLCAISGQFINSCLDQGKSMQISLDSYYWVGDELVPNRIPWSIKVGRDKQIHEMILNPVPGMQCCVPQ